jgi:two-component system cell cycle response regulator
MQGSEMALVLIVQDHDRARSDLAATLRSEGHTVLEAATAQAGTDLARSSAPAAILLDPSLPDRSGYELYASLQRDRETRAIPVLFLPRPSSPERAGRADKRSLVGGVDVVTRLGIALRTRLLHDQLRKANPELHAAVLTDSLTGLANRRALEEQVRIDTGRAALAGGLALVLGDLDRFNELNEQWGYAVGDHLLQAFAGQLHASCRTQDTVGRWRGGAFLLVLPGTGLDAAWHVAERLRAKAAELTSPIADDVPDAPKPTVSFGVTVHKAGERPDDLLDRVEAGLDRAKRSGRNRCEVA